MFEKRHIEAIAHALARQNAFASHSPRETTRARAITDELADMLARSNPRFDRVRFLRACGVKEADK